MRRGAIDQSAEPSDALSLGLLGDLAGYHLRRAFAVMSADFSRTFADSDMRQVLFAVLSVVSANPGISQGRVGTALGIKRTNMVTLVNQLVALDFVTRRPSTSDRRAFSLTLTDKGAAAFTQAAARIHRHETQLLAHLDTQEQQLLIDLLRKIRPVGTEGLSPSDAPDLSR
ncbi:DNA-binding MarR family transcriptional regulator [Sphingobium sp. B7D2B]|uniref:MarR family winged helix-turn-helix transcriptional regulator n=1 Tax=Sphingobium sp. B7D2B TaxID=2940583 RepID=UPI00222446D7|nr:MarR family transcriptional regulator [Sphingobium sp. B7D2B]MCW2366762.1 DNA-binding MarR family transcriptional regulator [Sphingobium sp. B7D2B]